MGGFELYHQRHDGTKGETIARGGMGHIVAHVRALGLISRPDPGHPLGVFYVNAAKEIFVIDFVLDRVP